MISNPLIADGPGAVRQLVKNGKPLDPAMQKLIDEKNARANATVHFAFLPQDPAVAVTPKRSHKAKLAQRAAEMKAKYTTPAGAKPVAHPLRHDATVARLMQILDGKAHVVLEPPDGMLPGEYMARLMETLRRSKDTSGHSWQCRNIGGRIVVKCNGPVDGPSTSHFPPSIEEEKQEAAKSSDNIIIDCKEPETAWPAATPAKNPAAVVLSTLGAAKGGHARAAALSPERRSEIASKASRARHGTPEAGMAPEVAEAPAVATGPNVALPAADLTDVHEFGLDIRHSPAAVALVLEPIEIPSDPAMHEKRAAFVEALPAVALALESQEAPTASPGADVARAAGQISDILPADPPEAARLVEEAMEWKRVMADGAEKECDQADQRFFSALDEICEATERHRRAKAITDALLEKWAMEWAPEGPPCGEMLADLARRIHEALVGVMAEAGKK